MTWREAYRDLIERCVEDAGAGRVVNSGQLSRFYKALSACPSKPDLADVELCLRALSVAGRPPLDTTRRAESSLIELIRGSKHDQIRHAATRALASYWDLHAPSELASARALSRMEAVDASSRFYFALLAGEDEDLTLAATLVARADLRVDELKALQERLLSQDELTAPTLALLEELYVNGSWLGRRILIRQLGPGHERLVPTLARVASRADPTTRRAVIAALERVGHVSAEPILVSLLSDVEPAVLSEVVAALGELGTRACMPRLSELRDAHPELSEAIGAAFARLDARFPTDARAGAISLAEEGPAGALSLAGATPGDVSLYRDVERKLSEHALAEAPQAALSSEAHWDRLIIGPRDIPLAFTLRELGVGKEGASLMAWLVLSGTLVSLDFTLAIAPYGLIVSVASFLLSSGHYPHYHHVLSKGVPAYAELSGHTLSSPESANGGADVYTFSYMDELERTHEIERIVLYPIPEILDDALEPILYTSSGRVVFFDEIDDLTVGEDGELTALAGVGAKSIIGPLLALAAALYISIMALL